MSHCMGMLLTLPTNIEFTQKLVWDKRFSLLRIVSDEEEKQFFF
jgi:hypothetical protein